MGGEEAARPGLLSPDKKPLVSSFNFSEIKMPQCPIFPKF